MRIRITDLLDEYMAGDIPLDPMPEPGQRQNLSGQRGGGRFLRIAAAVMVALSLSGAAGLMVLGRQSGSSLQAAPADTAAEAETGAPEAPVSDTDRDITMTVTESKVYRKAVDVTVEMTQEGEEHFSLTSLSCAVELERPDGQTIKGQWLTRQWEESGFVFRFRFSLPEDADLRQEGGQVTARLYGNLTSGEQVRIGRWTLRFSLGNEA